MNKAVLIVAALVLAPLALSAQAPDDKDQEAPSMQKGGEAPSMQKGGEPAASAERADEPSRSAFGERVVDAVETIERACASDIDNFCGDVTPGEARVALCMLAHEDQLSSRCSTALDRVARNLQRSVDRVAEQCGNEIQTICGGADRIRQCLKQERGSLSSQCQTIVAALEQRGPAPMIGMSVYSSDNKNLGQIVEVIRGPDDKVQSIQVDIGRLLGLGTKVVGITAEKLEQLPRVRLLLSDEEVRSLPESKTQ